MTRNNVVFVCINTYENLGVGYLSSMLSEAGFKSRIIDIRKGENEILKIVRRDEPVLIGFSVIFQYNIELFRNLVAYLRRNGVNSHFTAGGHYASLKPCELIDLIPELDSIVLFEGEKTVVELVRSLISGNKWKDLDGIAWKKSSKVVINPLRPLEEDLDIFPYPCRPGLKKVAFGIKLATIIAGRGCIHNCSFCNTREFYRKPGGPLKRIRDPEMVVQEMVHLYSRRDCTMFFFLDDDFPLDPKNDHQWVRTFCLALGKAGLSGRILWKICCRPDEIREDIFLLMKNNGLFQIFLGIEDGTDEGLKRLNKNIPSGKIMLGVDVLRKLNLDYDFGFMLFQPSSDFQSINKNLLFLETICRGGYTPVTFLKLLPYYDTRVERELVREGRLKMAPGVRDYDFLEEAVNQYYNFTFSSFNEWLLSGEGAANISNWGSTYYSIYRNTLGADEDYVRLRRNFKNIVSDGNSIILGYMIELSSFFEKKKYQEDNENILEKYRNDINNRHNRIKERLHNNLGKLIELPLKHII